MPGRLSGAGEPSQKDIIFFNQLEFKQGAVIWRVCLHIHNTHRCHLLLGFAYFSENSRKISGYIPHDLRHDVSVLRLKFMFLLRALEERLQEKQLSSPGLELEHILMQLDIAQEKEQHLQSEVTHLENR